MKTKRRNPDGFVIWLTGLPASGKTSLAEAIDRLLSRLDLPLVVIDSDHLRELLIPNPTYSSEERDHFYTTIARMAIWLAKSKINIIIAATAHKRAYRDSVREQIERFAEIFVDCNLEECQARDPKGIYAQAAGDKTNKVPGLGVEYEAPVDPELTIDTGRLFPKQAAYTIIEKLMALEILEIDENDYKLLFPKPLHFGGPEFASPSHI
jgi:adenylylsulfate kinase